MAYPGPAESLGERLRWVRTEALGMTSEAELAQRLQELPDEERPEASSQASVNRYERGLRSPPISFALAVARLGRVNPKWLLLGEGHPSDHVDADTARVRLDFIEAVLRAPIPAEIMEAHLHRFASVVQAWKAKGADAGNEKPDPVGRSGAGKPRPGGRSDRHERGTA